MAAQTEQFALLFKISGDSSDAEKAIKKVGDSAEKEIGSLSAKLSSSLSNIGSAITSAGTALTGAITVPLTALGTLGVKAALDLDEVRTRLAALTGSAENANQKITELYKLADTSVGVFRKGAVDTYAQLKGIGGIADETINKVVAAGGRLNAAFKIEDLAGFNQNLNQIFQQGFERSDIKEAIGRVPIFEQLLESAFGTSDGDKLRKLKESGKLTMDGFLSGLSDAIEKDPRLANLTENLSTKLAKSAERLNIALAPIGEAILSIIVPAIEALAPYLEQALNYFSSLSPAIKTVIVAIGAVVAALGPALLVIGSIITAIGGFVAAWGTLSTALAGVAIAPLLAKIAAVALAVVTALTALAAAGYALYQAWQRDFGGIRTYTIEIFNTIKEIVTTVISYLRSAIQTFLSYVREFWAESGEGIMSETRKAWSFISDTIRNTLDFVSTNLKGVLALIKGDWAGAWEYFKKIVKDAVAYTVSFLVGLGNTIASNLANFFGLVARYGTQFLTYLTNLTVKIVAGIVYVFATLPQRIIEIVPKLYAAGLEIGKAIIQGIKEGLTDFSGSVTGGIVGNQNEGAVLGLSGSAEIVSNSNLGGGGTDKRRKEREDAAKRDTAAQIELVRNQLQQVEKEYSDTLDRLRKNLAETGNTTEFLAGAEAALEKFTNETSELNNTLDALEDRQATAEKKRAAEIEVLQNEQNERARTLLERARKDKEENDKLILDAEKKKSSEVIKTTEDQERRLLEIARSSTELRKAELERDYEQGLIVRERYVEAIGQLDLQLLEREREGVQKILQQQNLDAEKRLDLQNRIKILDNDIARQRIENAERVRKVQEEDLELLRQTKEAMEGISLAASQLPGNQSEVQSGDGEEGTRGGGIFSGAIASIKELFNLGGQLPTLQSVFTDFANIVGGAFAQMASAVGSVIQNFVLYGNSAPAIMRKILASALAAIAAEATVRAIFELAAGFASLFFNPAEAAAHFTAAALFGSIAIGSALVGRAVAGNAFQQQVGVATGGGSSSSGNRGQAGAYSSQSEGTITQDRNAPSFFERMSDSLRGELTLKLDSNGVLKVVGDDIQRNGKTRGWILKVVEQS